MTEILLAKSCNSCNNILFLLAGKGKRDALLLAGNKSYVSEKYFIFKGLPQLSYNTYNYQIWQFRYLVCVD